MRKLSTTQPRRRGARRRTLALLAAVAAISALVPAAAQAAESLYGVTADNRLVTFNSDSAGYIRNDVPIAGLQAGERVVGIDVRPETDQLYALGSTSRVYLVNPTTGATRAVGTTQFAPLLVGSSFGFDFNPVADRARIVSDADQNLRFNPNDGTTVADTPLQYAPGDPGAGSNPQVVGSAYTNSTPSATTTQLFGIDTGRNTLVLQNPPNEGTLTTVGALGVDFGEVGGFDILGTTAYAAFARQGATATELFTINLATGAATKVARGDVGANIVALAAAGTVANDTTRPSLLIAYQRLHSKSALARKALRVGASCNETCALSARLTIGGVTVGSRTGAVRRTGGKANLGVALSATGRRLVTRPGTQRLLLTVTATDAAGNVRTARRAITAR